MKKIFTIISFLLLASIIASCSNTTDLNRNDSNDAMANSSRDHVIFYYPTAGVFLKEDQEVNNITFEDASAKVFSFSSKTEIVKPNNTEDCKILKINGKEYSLRYNRTYETALSSSNDLKSFGQYNSYISDTVRVDTRVTTGEIILFTNFDEHALVAVGNLSEDDAIKIADSTILSLYGENIVNEYTYDGTVYTNTELSTQYTVVYRKYVLGIPSNDAIQVSINMIGDVVGVNAKYLGLYSHVEQHLEKDAVDNALAILEQTFAETWTIGAATLIIDSEGDYYISAQLSHKYSDDIEAVNVYINVN